uniref:Uncharacterized protein n=1 Tax=Kuenenia stuttgartiensis TaxID=174633 RepID=Q1PXZ2_KUEST|nr:unknown protein [Candidatus Kuenenia stuttgartiensis]
MPFSIALNVNKIQHVSKVYSCVFIKTSKSHAFFKKLNFYKYSLIAFFQKTEKVPYENSTN